MTGQRLFTLAALTLLAVACNREAISPDEGHERLIDFSAYFAQDATKAQGEITGTVFPANDSIGVFACYTGDMVYDLTSVSPDFMYNQKVTYEGESNWTYSPVKYWPNNESEKISFFSYYPYISSEKALTAEDGIIGFSKSYAKGDPWLVYKLPKDAPYSQKDLLYGTPKFNIHKGTIESKVAFTLNHALACIADEVTVKMDQSLFVEMKDSVDITIKGLTIVYSNLTNKARLVLNSVGEPNWKEVISGELLTSRKYENLSIEEKAFVKTAQENPGEMTIDSGNGLFYIPLQIAGQPYPQAEITLSYTVTGLGDESFKDSVTTVIGFKDGVASKKQKLALTLTKNFNLKADIVTAEADGISMPEDLAATYENVSINYEVPDTTFTYTESVQKYIVPRTGTYQLEAWGAQGGAGVYAGAKGGYAKAKFNLSIGDVLYIYVGGKGGDGGASTASAGGSGGAGGWNGGGAGGSSAVSADGWKGGGGGGGATHIAMSDIGYIARSGEGVCTNLSFLAGSEGSLLLVAGGGGGGSFANGSAGSGGGTEGECGKDGYGNNNFAGYWFITGAYSYGASGGNGGSGSGGGEGNGGGGGGYWGGNAKTNNNSGDKTATGGCGGNSWWNVDDFRYNYVTSSFVTYSSADSDYPNPQYPADLDDPGNGLVIITFKNPL